MKNCELCGLENPDEARFCMKCGKDLDAGAVTSEIPPEMFEVDVDAFIPAAVSETAPLGGSQQKSENIQMEDNEEFVLPAPTRDESVQSFAHEELSDEPPEIQLTDVTADFAERRRFCPRCGIANPHEQRYCKNCGSALGGTVTREADRAFDTANAVPLKQETAEKTTLSDMSPPASDYYSAERSVERARREFSFAGGLSDWGVREWLMVILATLLVAALVWFFAFGGIKMFSSSSRRIHKAGGTMTGLSSFQYSIGGAFESTEAGQYDGRGLITFEKPNRDASDVTMNVPGRDPLHVQQIEVENKPYTLQGSQWQSADPGVVQLDLSRLWSGFSSVEDLGMQQVAGVNCFHYKYRIPHEIVTGIIGIWQPAGVSDAIMEIWIDSSNSRIVKLTAQVFGVQIEGLRTRVTLTMDLAATDQAYDIKPPY